MDKRIVCLGAALLFAGSAVASSSQETPWYLGARAGATLYNAFDDNQTSKITGDNNWAGGVFVGYSFNDWFGLEGAYTYLGEVELDDESDVRNNTVELTGKFTWEATDSFDVFAKAGAFGYKTKATSGPMVGNRDKGVSGTAGLGIEQHFTDSFSVRLEYQYYYQPTLEDNGYESEWDTHLLALGLIYNWGDTEKVAVTEAPVTQVIEEEVVEEVVVEEVVVVVVEKAPMKVEHQTVQVYFDFDKEGLSAESVEQLQPIVNHLQEYPEATVYVVGHTDSRGASEFNQALSEQRAQTVSDYLTKEYSISADRITTSGEGEAVPIATNETAEGRAQNRRVSVFSPSFVVTEE